MYLTFQVFDYEVRGNADDGYHIKTLFPTNLYIRLSEHDLVDDTWIAQVLAREAVTLNANGLDRAAKDLEIRGGLYEIRVNEVLTGKPLFELRLVEIDRDRKLANEVRSARLGLTNGTN